MVKKTGRSSDNFKSYKRLISAASNYLDRLGAKRVAFRGSRNSFMAVRQVQLIYSLFLQRKEKSRDRSKGQAAYLADGVDGKLRLSRQYFLVFEKKTSHLNVGNESKFAKEHSNS